MKPRTVLLVLLALVCGVSAAVGVNQLNTVQSSAKDATVSVVLATQDVQRGDLLTAENCALKSWPKSLLPEGAVTQLENALERTVMVPLVKGEPVLDGKITGKEFGKGLAAMIPPGMRAFTIQTPHVAAGVGGFILPGNNVDVLLTTHTNQPDGSGGAATTTLLQNVQILAVDRRLDTPDGSKPDEKDPRSVTLLVTPNQAAKLDLGMNMGMLHLSLRHPEDKSEAITRPATLADIRYQQERPVSGLAARASQLAGAMARIWGRGGEEPAPEATGEPAEPKPLEYRSVNIRTLRGSNRGHIRIDTLP
jgi:pilus assembly protein CpaB